MSMQKFSILCLALALNDFYMDANTGISVQTPFGHFILLMLLIFYFLKA